MRVLDVGGDLLALHHLLAFLGEPLLLARLDIELLEFVAGVACEIGRLLTLGEAAALACEFSLQRPQPGVSRARRFGVGLKAAIGVDQRAVSGRVEQRPLVVLAVNFDEIGGERAQASGRRRSGRWRRRASARPPSARAAG